MLDAQGYLARVVAPGGYYAFAYKRPESGIIHRFFPQSQVAAAVSFLHEYSRSYDVWVGVASYRDADLQGYDTSGRQRFKGKRTQANAEQLKCFWYDADIARPGDGKSPDRVWADDRELGRWLLRAEAGGLPLPNLWIRSGYGVHLYWVMDTALPAAQWLPHARAFKNMLATLGARGDIGISADSARILRPPETWNRKVPTSPAPCLDMTPVRAGLPPEYPTGNFLSILQPFVTTGSTFLGTLPAGFRVNTGLLKAAKAGVEKPPPYDFDQIAAQCPQVAQSLAEEGEHDEYAMWHDMTNLAYACRNREAADRIGRGHAKYSPADTQAKWDLTERERQGKDFGAPLCATIDVDSKRPGVCSNCPHWGQIKSPYSLGKPAALPGTMPSNYRQTEDAIEQWVKDDWSELISGVMSDVQLLHYGGGGYRLTYDYTLSGQVHHVGINEAEITIGADRLRPVLIRQGVGLNRYNTSHYGDLLMSWIEELRRNRMYVEAPPPFGWVTDEDGEYLGLAVAGTVYQVDGNEGPAQPGDRKINESYRPKGSIEKWRESAEFVTKGRPDLQALVAAAFAAPLMEFVGESAVMSVWSARSGARKTSAFRVGTAVWANPITGMSAIRDTTNSVQHSLGETRIMPVYWDELHAANKDQIAAMVEMIFNITQGRGRSRLDSTIQQRDVGYWRTLMILSANRSIGEMIEQDRAHTNAGALRLFEFQMEPVGLATLEASTTVAQVERNYGHAGRIFAAWVAQNIPKTKEFIARLRKQLGHDLRVVDPNERFHVATVLGIVTGAHIASRELKLLPLDTKAIYRFLLDKMLEQRIERQIDAPVDDEGKHLGMTFERFMSDCVDDLLVTQSFTPVGRPKIGPSGSDRVKVIKRPGPQCARAMIHIGLDDGEMRFDNNRFKKWCYENKLSPKAMFSLMYKIWPVRKVQAILGIGTDYSSGAKVWYHVVQLNRPGLRHHLSWGTPNPDATNVVTLPLRDPAE